MRFDAEQQLDRLVVDVTEIGVLGKHEDAKYYWFKQAGNEWEPVENLTRFIAKQRGIGLLKSTSFKIVLDGNEFRTSDLISIQGKIGLRYKVIHPGKLIEYHDNLSQQLLDIVSSVLTNEFFATTSDGFRKQLPEIKSQTNKKLKVEIADLGIDLSIINLELFVNQEAIIETASEDALRLRAEIGLQDLRNQLNDSIQNNQIQWQVNQLLRLAEANAQIERASIDNTLYQVEKLLPPGTDPYLVTAFVLAQKDPAAGDVIAKLVDTQGQLMIQAEKTRLLSSYLENKSKVRTSSTFATSPQLISQNLNGSIQQPRLQPPEDPIIQAVRSAFPSVINCPLPVEDSGGKKYTISFERLVISFTVRPNGISRVQYGTSQPTTQWSETIPPGNGPQEIVNLINNIKNYLDKRQKR